MWLEEGPRKKKNYGCVDALAEEKCLVWWCGVCALMIRIAIPSSRRKKIIYIPVVDVGVKTELVDYGNDIMICTC